MLSWTPFAGTIRIPYNKNYFGDARSLEYEALISKIWAFFGGNGVLNIPSPKLITSDQNVVMEAHGRQPEPVLLENLAQPCISPQTIENNQDQIDDSQNKRELTDEPQFIKQAPQIIILLDQLDTNVSASPSAFVTDAFNNNSFDKYTQIQSSPIDLISHEACKLPSQRLTFGMKLFSSNLLFSSQQTDFTHISTDANCPVIARPHHIASSFMAENSEMYARLLFRRHKLKFRMASFDQLLQKFGSYSNLKSLRSQ